MDRIVELLAETWPYVAGAINLALSLGMSAHAVLHKRDTRAAIGWVGIIWFAPVVGAVLYILFGINRIQRRAASLRARHPAPGRRESVGLRPTRTIEEALVPEGVPLEALGRVVGEVTGRELLAGNRVTPLVEGDRAFPEMLEAIREAQRSVSLATYIFDKDPVGDAFLEALAQAVRRGVAVRVLIDDVGARYSRRSMVRRLARAGVRVESFLPTFVPWRFRYSNLRNHRKILVADGRLGFTGGMNLRVGHCLERSPRYPVRDIHFRIEGPVVAELQETFGVDWTFSTGEILDGDLWFPRLEPAGQVLCRGIPDGPDEDFEKLSWTVLGALACARSSVLIAVPYFLPDVDILAALKVAALRGVEVDVLLPGRNNLRLIQWASTALLPELVERGVRVWLTPPPFDHTKLIVVDGAWTLLGSANLDARSLRLNFEFNVECYCRELARELSDILAGRRDAATRIDAETLRRRPLPAQIRDNAVRLLAPYL